MDSGSPQPPKGPAAGPSESKIADWTDHYFLRTKATVAHFGDATVTYAVFMRRPVVSAPRLALDWLQSVAKERGTEFKIDLVYPEGKWVGAGEPILYITGSLVHLSDLETILLMKLGPACVAAFNAFTMCADLPNAAFLAMDARHCAGLEMAEIMAYAASVGSARAKRKVGAKGFIGNATEATAHYFGQEHALGTMPHALIGYAGYLARRRDVQ
jgi:nicotinate phosphoribosyltransferase